MLFNDTIAYGCHYNLPREVTHINAITMPVVPLNMHLKWFLQIFAVKLINNMEKCAGIIMRKSVLVHYVVEVCQYPPI